MIASGVLAFTLMITLANCLQSDVIVLGLDEHDQRDSNFLKVLFGERQQNRQLLQSSSQLSHSRDHTDNSLRCGCSRSGPGNSLRCGCSKGSSRSSHQSVSDGLRCGCSRSDDGMNCSCDKTAAVTNKPRINCSCEEAQNGQPPQCYCDVNSSNISHASAQSSLRCACARRGGGNLRCSCQNEIGSQSESVDGNQPGWRHDQPANIFKIKDGYRKAQKGYKKRKGMPFSTISSGEELFYGYYKQNHKEKASKTMKHSFKPIKSKQSEPYKKKQRKQKDKAKRLKHKFDNQESLAYFSKIGGDRLEVKQRPVDKESYSLGQYKKKHNKEKNYLLNGSFTPDTNPYSNFDSDSVQWFSYLPIFK